MPDCFQCTLHRQDWEEHRQWINEGKAGWAFMLLRDEADRLELENQQLKAIIGAMGEKECLINPIQ